MVKPCVVAHSCHPNALGPASCACLMLVRGDDSFTGIHPALPASAPPLAAHQWYNRFRFSSREAYSLVYHTH